MYLDSRNSHVCSFIWFVTIGLCIPSQNRFGLDMNYIKHHMLWDPSPNISTCEDSENRSSTSPCVSQKVTEWGGPSDETKEIEDPCHTSCGTIKIPTCSKVLSAEHRSKVCSPSPAMVTSPFKSKILERDVKQ
jgi:hypothetical protein